MLPGLKNQFLILAASTFLLSSISCSKKSGYIADQQSAVQETAIKENLNVDAASVSFESAGESKVKSFTLSAPVSRGSKKYFIAGMKASGGLDNAFITVSEFSPVTEESQQEDNGPLSLIYKNTKQQLIHVKWDDGQVADFTVNASTSFTITLPEKWESTITSWKTDRRKAIEDVKKIVTSVYGLRVKADKPVIQ